MLPTHDRRIELGQGIPMAAAPRCIDPSFLAQPMHHLADSALTRARELGADYADFRLDSIRDAEVVTRDAQLEGARDNTDVGFSVRVVHEGASGFAAGPDLTPDAAVRVAEQAVNVASISRSICSQRVELADEPAYVNAVWTSEYDINPFDVPATERVAVLCDWSERLLDAPGVDHVSAKLRVVQENKFYANLAGTTTTQQRVRIHPQLLVLCVDPSSGSLVTMRTLAPPVGRGWEYMTGVGWDWDAELAAMPGWLQEKVKAVPIAADSYDLVIDPTNLWLTIHESIGHATELDRALGHEVAYAGSTFATIDKLGNLTYGSPLMQVTGDRTVTHGLATTGYDDEGVATGCWEIVRDGVFVGYQTDRQTAHTLGLPRSNGCAFAESAYHLALQRMPNVSLQPIPDGPSTEDLIGDLKQGLFIVGDRSWSIDMQRCNFQFTGQRVYRIKGGRLQGQVRDIAYQSTSTEFWRSMVAVGGPATYLLAGADNCGKGQPGQVAAASHGSPSALFRGIRVLDTGRELEL